MIIDLSFPSGVSVNGGIPDSEAQVKFSFADNAIDFAYPFWGPVSF